MITEWISWPWVFYINIPIALVVLAFVPSVMPAAAARRGSIDLAGAVTATAGLALSVFAIVRAPAEGWDRRRRSPRSPAAWRCSGCSSRCRRRAVSR